MTGSAPPFHHTKRDNFRTLHIDRNSDTCLSNAFRQFANHTELESNARSVLTAESDAPYLEPDSAYHHDASAILAVTDLAAASSTIQSSYRESKSNSALYIRLK